MKLKLLFLSLILCINTLLPSIISGTLIKTSNGYKTIENITLGDALISSDNDRLIKTTVTHISKALINTRYFYSIQGTHTMSINFITIKNIDNFKQIIESRIFIDCNNVELDREISTNMWAISISSKILQEISLDNLLEFIKTLLYSKSRQISQFSCSAIFYMWFDEMASQLRFNIISDFHKKLPFSCKVNIHDSPIFILKYFLESQQNPVIPWKDLEEITDNTEEDIDDEIPFVLDVFVVKLNKSLSLN